MTIKEEFENVLEIIADSGQYEHILIVADISVLKRKWEPKTLLIVPAELQFAAHEWLHSSEVDYFTSRAIIPSPRPAGGEN